MKRNVYTGQRVGIKVAKFKEYLYLLNTYMGRQP